MNPGYRKTADLYVERGCLSWNVSVPLFIGLAKDIGFTTNLRMETYHLQRYIETGSFGYYDEGRK